jgi:trimethylguanosine synthase
MTIQRSTTPVSMTQGNASATNPFGEAVQKYWDLRYSFFARWDEGIQTDLEGLYSVKPEAAADAIARALPGKRVLDAFCGIGGSAIAFARAGKKVITVDVNSARLEMARHNARLHGVEDRVKFVAGDALEQIAAGQYDAVYLDPPWGGPDYSRIEFFALSHFSPDGNRLLEAAFARTDLVGLSVPRNFDFRELPRWRRPFRFESQENGERVVCHTFYFGG